MITPKPQTVVELFEGHPERWSKYWAARDVNNKPVADDSPEACKFCPFGAIEFIYGHYCTDGALMWNKIKDAFGGYASNVFNWNDAPERTFEEVLAKCKELGI